MKFLQWSLLRFILVSSLNLKTIAQGCFPGSYRASSSECLMCEAGFYQAESYQSNCTACPHGRTTTAGNNTSVVDCLPDCDVGRYIMSDGCKLCNIGEYQSLRLQSGCNKCGSGYTTTQRGSVQGEYCVNSTVNGCTNRPCENNGLCVAVSDTYYCSCPLGYGGDNCQQANARPVVWSVHPLYGPVSGGTLLTLTGQYFSPRNLMGVYLEDVRCNIVSSNSSHITAVTPDLHSQQEKVVPTDWPISVLFVPNTKVQTTYVYNFKPDPVVKYLYPKNTILSGGTTISVNGSNLNSTGTPPILAVITQYKQQVLSQPLTYKREYQQYHMECSVVSSDVMYCPTPRLTLPSNYTSPQSTLARMVNHNLLSFSIKITFDGVVYTESEPLMVFMNPTIQQFVPLVQDYTANSGDRITIQGNGLDVGLDISEFNITVGDDECTGSEIANNTMTCTPPQQGSEENSTQVLVSVGNIQIPVGYLRYVYLTTTEVTTAVAITTTQEMTTVKLTTTQELTTVAMTTKQETTTTIDMTTPAQELTSDTTEPETSIQTTGSDFTSSDLPDDITEDLNTIATTLSTSTFIDGITGAGVALFLTFVVLITFCALVVWSVRQRKLKKLKIASEGTLFPPGYNGGMMSRYERVMDWLLPNEGTRNYYTDSSNNVTPILVRRTNHPDIYYSSHTTPEIQRHSQLNFVGTPVLTHHQTPTVLQLSNASPLSTPEMSRHPIFRSNSFPTNILQIYSADTPEMMFSPWQSTGHYIHTSAFYEP